MMDWFLWYLQNISVIFQEGVGGQWSPEGYFVFFCFIFILCGLLPFWLYRNTFDQEKIQGIAEKLANDLGGYFVTDPDSSLGIDEVKRTVLGNKINFKLKGEACQVILYAFPISFLTRVTNLVNDAPWSTIFKLEFSFDTNLHFSVKLSNDRSFSDFSFFHGNRQINEKRIAIDHQEDFNKVLTYEDLIELLKSIEFYFRPQFILEFDGRVLSIRVGKTENTISEVQKYLDFMEKIIDRVRLLKSL